MKVHIRMLELPGHVFLGKIFKQVVNKNEIYNSIFSDFNPCIMTDTQILPVFIPSKCIIICFDGNLFSGKIIPHSQLDRFVICFIGRFFI